MIVAGIEFEEHKPGVFIVYIDSAELTLRKQPGGFWSANHSMSFQIVRHEKTPEQALIALLRRVISAYQDSIKCAQNMVEKTEKLLASIERHAAVKWLGLTWFENFDGVWCAEHRGITLRVIKKEDSQYECEALRAGKRGTGTSSCAEHSLQIALRNLFFEECWS